MNITTVVLTAPRPKKTLDRTLRSLQAAGMNGVHVYNDSASSGHFRAYMAAMQYAIGCNAGADAYFIVEDDVVFCRGLHDYLQRTLWPGPVEKTALCSPYCPKAYRQPTPGWHDAQSHRGYYLAGSQAWIFSAEAARAILAEVAPLGSPYNADWEIGKWAGTQRRRIWHHTPSLAQHEGIGNSALGDGAVTDIRHAADFVGEPYDAADLRPTDAQAPGKGATR